MASKNGDYGYLNKLDAAIKAANDLSNLMEKAYGIRVVADYNQSVSVVFSSTNEFKLQEISIIEANKWSERANAWCGILLGVLRQINV